MAQLTTAIRQRVAAILANGVDKISTNTLEANAISTELEVGDSGTDKTSSRSSDVVYQNTTGHDLLVSAIFEPDSSSSRMHQRFEVGRSTSLGFAKTVAEISIQAVDTDDRLAQTFTVPDGYYYKATPLGADDSSVVFWVERRKANVD